MPENSRAENKLHLPDQGEKQTKKTWGSGDRSGGSQPLEKPDVASDKNAGFWARLSSKSRSQERPDESAHFLGNDRPEAPPAWEPEGWESSPPIAAPEDHSSRLLHLKSEFPWWFIRRVAQRKICAGHALAALGAAVCVTALLSAAATWNLGVQAGKQRLLEEQTKADAPVSDEVFARLNLAFDDLRAGNSGNALKAFQELAAKNPDVSSMAYLAALAAMRSKNFPLAEEQAARSIRKRERVSDSMAIQALLEIQKGEDPNIKKFGDHVLRAELLLRRAMLADPASPVPMIELAALLRGQKRNAEAIQLLQAARTRVQPFDLPPFLEATIALATLQNTPDSELPRAGDPGKDLPAAVTAAYLSMRKGEWVEAAKTLRGIRIQTSPSSFRYLMNDQAMRPYSRVRELQEFFF